MKKEEREIKNLWRTHAKPIDMLIASINQSLKPLSKSLTSETYQQIDGAFKSYASFVTKQNKTTIKCEGKGCNHCCHILTLVTKPEAHLIKRFLSAKSIKAKPWSEPVKKFIAEINPVGDIKKRNRDYCQLISTKDRRCIFLSAKGECTIYPVRPIACRNYAVVTPPEDCDTDMSKPTAAIDARWIDIAYAQSKAINGASDYMYLQNVDFKTETTNGSK